MWPSPPAALSEQLFRAASGGHVPLRSSSRRRHALGLVRRRGARPPRPRAWVADRDGRHRQGRATGRQHRPTSRARASRCSPDRCASGSASAAPPTASCSSSTPPGRGVVSGAPWPAAATSPRPGPTAAGPHRDTTIPEKAGRRTPPRVCLPGPVADRSGRASCLRLVPVASRLARGRPRSGCWSCRSRRSRCPGGSGGSRGAARGTAVARVPAAPVLV